jgi:hypothetical protein
MPIQIAVKRREKGHEERNSVTGAIPQFFKMEG